MFFEVRASIYYMVYAFYCCRTPSALCIFVQIRVIVFCFIILLLIANMLAHSFLLRLVIYVGIATMFSGVLCVMRSCSFDFFLLPCVSIFSTCAFLIILFNLCFIWSLLRLLFVSWSRLYFCIMVCICLFQGVFLIHCCVFY